MHMHIALAGDGVSPLLQAHERDCVYTRGYYFNSIFIISIIITSSSSSSSSTSSISNRMVDTVVILVYLYICIMNVYWL